MHFPSLAVKFSDAWNICSFRRTQDFHHSIAHICQSYSAQIDNGTAGYSDISLCSLPLSLISCMISTLIWCNNNYISILLYDLHIDLMRAKDMSLDVERMAVSQDKKLICKKTQKKLRNDDEQASGSPQRSYPCGPRTGPRTSGSRINNCEFSMMLEHM